MCSSAALAAALCHGVQSGELRAVAGVAGEYPALVAHPAPAGREVGEDRREGGAACEVRDVSDGGGGDPAPTFRDDPASHQEIMSGSAVSGARSGRQAGSCATDRKGGCVIVSRSCHPTGGYWPIPVLHGTFNVAWNGKKRKKPLDKSCLERKNLGSCSRLLCGRRLNGRFRLTRHD